MVSPQATRRKRLRDTWWPNLTDLDVWHSKPTGFAMVPRTMPLLMQAMDSLSIGKPVSGVYFELWCSAFEDAIVEISDPRLRAYYCGFSGPRAISTWNARMRTLVELGFVEAKAGLSGDFGVVLLRNPYLVLSRISNRIDPMLMNEIHSRMAAIGVQEPEASA